MRLLVVEDEERVASFLAKGLRAHGYSVEWVSSGREALRRATSADISLVILDLGLPDLDGIEVLTALRAQGVTVPVLVLSARGRVNDRVKGLNHGADDYLVKPFAFEELVARVRANLRPRTAVSPNVLRVGGICVDLLQRKVTIDGRTVNLSAREFSAEGLRYPPPSGPVPAGAFVVSLGDGLRSADEPRRRVCRVPPPQARRARDRDGPRGGVLSPRRCLEFGATP